MASGKRGTGGKAGNAVDGTGSLESGAAGQHDEGGTRGSSRGLEIGNIDAAHGTSSGDGESGRTGNEVDTPGSGSPGSPGPSDAEKDGVAVAGDPIPIKRERGRPRLSDAERAQRATQRASQKAGLSVSPSRLAVEKVQGMHAMLHVATGGLVPNLSTEQAKALTEAVGSLSAHYGVAITGPTVLWINLVATLATLYGPNAMLVIEHRMRNAKERREAARRGGTLGSVVMPDGTAAVINMDGTPHNVADQTQNPNAGKSPGEITLG